MTYKNSDELAESAKFPEHVQLIAAAGAHQEVQGAKEGMAPSIRRAWTELNADFSAPIVGIGILGEMALQLDRVQPLLNCAKIAATQRQLDGHRDGQRANGL
jgi:hypothetical protein